MKPPSGGFAPVRIACSRRERWNTSQYNPPTLKTGRCKCFFEQIFVRLSASRTVGRYAHPTSSLSSECSLRLLVLDLVVHRTSPRCNLDDGSRPRHLSNRGKSTSSAHRSSPARPWAYWSSRRNNMCTLLRCDMGRASFDYITPLVGTGLENCTHPPRRGENWCRHHESPSAPDNERGIGVTTDTYRHRLVIGRKNR